MKPLCFLAGLAALGSLASLSGAAGMTISDDPKSIIHVRIAADSGERVAGAAHDLSVILEKMFGKSFPVEFGLDGAGIVLATVRERPELADTLKADAPGAFEGYLIRSTGDQVLLIGASALGVQNATWDFLHRLGYRHYFPGKKWEFIPKLDRFDVSFERTSHPAFATREIFVGYGVLKESQREFKEWKKHNRLDYGFRLFTGHSYDGIIRRNPDAFREHPEYLAGPLKETGRGDKFNVANEGLRKLVVKDALLQFEKNPELLSISLDPSDGGGWPESSPLGSVSNQVVTLANEVAVALREAVPGKKVGIYAYNQHSPAPSIRVDRDVVVSVATAFINGGQPFEELMKQWKAQGAELGVRDYLAVMPWDHDLPGKSKASSPDKVAESLRYYHDLGARYYTAETSYSAGPNGLGHFVAAQCLWDPSEAENVTAIREEFLSRCFGSSKEPMRKFYRLMDGKTKPLMSDHLLGSMYRVLEEAYAMSADEAVLTRIDDLAAYTRFVELFRQYSSATGPERQAAFDRLSEFVTRIASLGVVHTKGMLRDMPVRDRTISLNAALVSAAGAPPDREELQGWIAEGVGKYALLGFEPKAFGRDLVPLTEFADGDADAGDTTLRLRGKNSIWTSLEAKGDRIVFSVEGGQLNNRNTGPVRIRIYPQAHPLGEAICELEIAADKTAHPVEVKSDYAGLHRIEIDDGGNLTFLTWPLNRKIALPSGQEDCVYLNGRYNLCFFVPKGTRRIGGYAGRPTGRLLNARGEERFRFSELSGAGYFDVPVPEGEDQSVWRVEQGLGKMLLMTVPPYLAPDEDSLLVPEEVKPSAVRADSEGSY